MKDWGKLDLRNTTIFDLTNDINIITKEFGVLMPKDKYNSIISIETRIKDLLDFTDLTDNNLLKQAIYKEFKDELNTFKFE